MMKRLFTLVLTLMMLCSCALAEDWLSESHAPGAVDQATDKTVYDAADTAGVVVNASDPGNPGVQEAIVYSFTPLDVVLVVDVSGSMDRSDMRKNLLGYAKDAAAAFTRTLLSINPASRIGVVEFSSDASVISDLRGLNDQQELLSAIGRMSLAGNTNTGSGYALAADMLSSQAMAGRRCMVLMITDGQANAGEGDPIQYAVSKGKACAAMGSVYTIGLVGGMGSSEKKATRKVLNSGYETRYFEVDFDEIGDAGAVINMLTTSIAVAASSAETIDGSGEVTVGDTYQLALSGGYDVRVEHASSEYLSSTPDDYRDSASFGSLTEVNDDKYLVLVEDDYAITIQGSESVDSSYELSMLKGLSMDEQVLASETGWTHPSETTKITLKDGEAAVEDIGYDVLDPYAVDNAGQPVTGLDTVADGRARQSISPAASPVKNSPVVMKLKKQDHVSILAKDSAANMYFVSFTDKNGQLSRGWVSTKVLDQVQGYVPEMVWLDGDYIVSRTVDARRAPESSATVAFSIDGGTSVTLRHVERDFSGQEWAYVSVTRKKVANYVYIPADCLEGWTTIAPENFRLSHKLQPVTTEISLPEIGIAAGQKLKVYSGPGTSYWRGAKGKALVNTNGGLNACGWVNNNWLLVQYGTSIGNYRVGYVQASDIRVKVPVQAQIVLASEPATVITACVLSDDPCNFSEQIVTLEPGTVVTWLGSYTYTEGQPLDYIETTVNKKKVRGFLPEGCLER